MTTKTIVDFVSRECKDGTHQGCCGKWEGLGFEIICDCRCGHKKNSQALEEVEGQLANAKANKSSQEETQNDYR